MTEVIRVCIDSSANESIDRFGGIGRYSYLLLEAMLSLPASERAGLDLSVLERSDRVVGIEEALEKKILDAPPIPLGKHQWKRRLHSGRPLRAAGVDVFHSVEPLALPLLSRTKTLVTCHDLIPLAFPRPNRPLKKNWIKLRETARWSVRMRRAEHILAISEQTARDLNRLLRIPRSRISVVHHGVDRSLFRQDADVDPVRKKFDLPERWFVSVGSDHYRKNQERLLDAWCTIHRDIPEGLVVVGKSLYGSTLDAVRSKVEKLGIGARFRWLESVEDADLPALYAGATAAIAPSLYEGFGMTLLEAMACGTPVAAATNGAYEEVGGDAAIYFDGLSVDEMAGTLTRLSSDAALRQRLVEAGLSRAQEMSWEQTARNTLAVYRRMAMR